MQALFTLLLSFYGLCLTAQEICDNGIDDDGNGLTDLQDEAACSCTLPNTPPSLLPNPSFELFNAGLEGCTSRQPGGLPDNFSQVTCSEGWLPTRNGTTDVWNSLSYAAADLYFVDRLPQPIPNGTGLAGLIATSVSRNTHVVTGEQQLFYREYLVACLDGAGALSPGTEYEYRFQIGFSERFSGSKPEQPPLAVNSEVPARLALYGITDCGAIRDIRPGCDGTTTGPEWELIQSFTVSGTPLSWTSHRLRFIADKAYAALALGADCYFSPVENSDSIRQNYYFFDEVRLNTPEVFMQNVNRPVKVSGSTVCDDDLLLIGTRVAGASYQWFLDDVALPGETLPDLFPPAEGEYRLRTTVDGECSLSDPITIEPLFLPASIVPDTFPLCANSDSVRVFSPYFDERVSYRWSNGSERNFIYVSEPGDYAVTLTGECLDRVETFHVTDQRLPTFTVSATTARDCDDSTVTVRIDTDWGFSSFDLTNGQDSLLATRIVTGREVQLTLSGGDSLFVTGYVRDCGAFTQGIRIRGRNDFVVTPAITNFTCTRDRARISLQLEGDPPATFRWTDADGNRIGNDSPVLEVRDEGRYAVTISGLLRCDYYEEYVVGFDGNIRLAPTADWVDCNDTLATVTSFAFGGIPPYRIDALDAATDTVILRDFDGRFPLPAGDYRIRMTDGTGCQRDQPLTVPTSPLRPTLRAEVTADCNGDGATLNLISKNLTTPLQISLNDTPPDSLTRLEGLPNGNYRVRVIDATGCRAELTGVVVTAPLAFTVDAGPNRVFRLGSTTRLLGSTTLPEDAITSYAWSPAVGLSCQACAEPMATPTTATIYRLTVTSTDGCQQMDSVRVVPNDRADYYFPTAFSPNGDGVNDRYEVFLGPGATEVLELHITDRWGKLYYAGRGGWDGTVSGQAAASGVYVYRARLRLGGGREIMLQGAITLLR